MHPDRLSCTQEDVRLTGHAIECRINAENPEKEFPSVPGNDHRYVSSGRKGYPYRFCDIQWIYIPPYYDSMVAKLIVWAKNRQEAIR